MNTILALLLAFIHCALSGKSAKKMGIKIGNKLMDKRRDRYNNAKKWPTEKPTMSPTAYQCPSKYMDPSKDSIEIVFVVDNSCGLTKNECRVQMKEIADTFWQIKVDDPPYFTKVAYIEYLSQGAKTKISFDDKQYQRDVDKFYDFILKEAGCGQGGNGKSDVVAGLNKAIDEFLLNGDKDCDVKRKVIVFNNCENTGYKYNDDDRKMFEEEVLSQGRDIEYFENAPDFMVINVPSQDKPARNVISAPYDYLSFLIGDKSSRKGSASQLYAAPLRYLNDDEMTSEDFTKAAVIEDGRIRDRGDVYRNDDRICRLVGKPNTKVPTEEPTANPTEYPTEYPTEDPTEQKKVCFEIEYEMKKMAKSMKGKSVKSRQDKCMASWSLSKDGRKKAVEFGDVKGYKKCVYIEYESFDYTLSINKGCGKVTWYVDGTQCGEYDFDDNHGKKQHDTKDFPLRCSKYDKYRKW